jgi:hypothetical protein
MFVEDILKMWDPNSTTISSYVPLNIANALTLPQGFTLNTNEQRLLACPLSWLQD